MRVIVVGGQMQTLHFMHCCDVRAALDFAIHALLWCEGQCRLGTSCIVVVGGPIQTLHFMRGVVVRGPMQPLRFMH